MASEEKAPREKPQLSDLMDAARVGDLGAVERMLADNPALGCAQEEAEGRTALHWAASAGRLDCVKALLPWSDPGQTTVGGNTALMLAAQNEETAVVEALLPHSNARAANRLGETALSLAVNTKSLRCALALLPESDARAADHNGTTALMIAAALEDIGLVRALLPHSDAKKADKSGLTALMFAAESVECVRELLPRSDVEAEDNNKRTAWECALAEERWECADLMFASLGAPGARRLMEMAAQAEATGMWEDASFPRCQALAEREAIEKVVAQAKGATGEGGGAPHAEESAAGPGAQSARRL